MIRTSNMIGACSTLRLPYRIARYLDCGGMINNSKRQHNNNRTHSIRNSSTHKRCLKCLAYVSLFRTAGRYTLRTRSMICDTDPLESVESSAFGICASGSLKTYGMAFKEGGATPSTMLSSACLAKRSLGTYGARGCSSSWSALFPTIARKVREIKNCFLSWISSNKNSALSSYRPMWGCWNSALRLIGFPYVTA